MRPPNFAGAPLFMAVTLLALAALASALVGETAAAHARHDGARAASAFTVRIETPQDDGAGARAAAILADMPGVTFAAAMTRTRAAQLIEAAGGGPVDPETLPEARIVEAARDPAIATDAVIDDALRRAGYRAEIIAPAPPRDDRAAIAGAAGFGGAGLALGILALVMALAAQGASGPAAVGADLGAPRGRVLAAYGRSAAAFGFLAGGLAALAVAGGAAGLLTGRPDPVSFGDMVARISPMEAAIVLLGPLAAALAATIGARWGAAVAYDAADMLG